MTVAGFKKITPVNGFDESNEINARQNNYAWSMAELGDYLYVGTARNVPYLALSSGFIGKIPPPPEISPPPGEVDNLAEIWRYKKDGSEGWVKIFKASTATTTGNVFGFRAMVTYKNAIYACAYTIPYPGTSDFIKLVKITHDSDNNPQTSVIIQTNVVGASSRAMIIHNDELYISVLGQSLSKKTSQIYRTSTPDNLASWVLVTGDHAVNPNNPNGEGQSLCSFNNKLYVGTGLAGGYEVWRSMDSTPAVDKWQLVVDKGAGDALNEAAFTMGVFKDHLYVGSAILLGILSFSGAIVQPKGFDIIRIDENDNWELVVGGDPVEPTTPTIGSRNKSLYKSGFDNIANGYCWQIQEYRGELYVGSWEWLDMILPLYNSAKNSGAAGVTGAKGATLQAQSPSLDNLILEVLAKYPDLLYVYIPLISYKIGFDMYKSCDGIHWNRVTINGLNNTENYGLRKLFKSDNGNLYLGTANPFEGCEVWVKKPPATPLESLIELIEEYFCQG